MPPIRNLTARQKRALEQAHLARQQANQTASRQVEAEDENPETEQQETRSDWRARLRIARDRRQDAASRLEAMIGTLEEVAERVDNQECAAEQVDANYGDLLDIIDGLAGEVERNGAEERRLSGASAVGQARAAQPDPNRRFGFARAILGRVRGWEESDAMFERGVLEQVYRDQGMTDGQVTRALEFTIGGSAGLLIPSQLLGDWIDALRPNVIAGALGANFQTYGGPVSIAKVLNGATSIWLAEGKKGTFSSLSTGGINLTPKPLATFLPFSDSFLRYAPARAEGDVNRDMALSQATALDYALLVGGGGEGSPMGIKNLAGGTTSFSSADYLGADQNITDLIDAIAAAPATRNVQGPVGAAMHPSALLKLRTAKDANGQPLLKETIVTPSVDAWVNRGTIHHLPYATTTQLAAGATADLIVAVWNELRVASFGVAEVMVSREAADPVSGASAFMQRQTWLRLSTEWDSGLRHTEAVQVASGWNVA